MKFVDIGANLTDDMFQGLYRGSRKHKADLEEVLRRGVKCGVGSVMCTVGSVEDIQPAFDLIRDYSNIMKLKCTLGIHPTRGNEFKKHPDLPNLLRKTFDENKDKIIAYGEFGLDWDRLHFCSKEQQLKTFELQLSIAQEVGLPLFLHCRAATDEFVEILERNRSKWEGLGGVVHSFTGTKEELEKILALGFHVSINGVGLKEEFNLEAAASIPLDKLLIETDCPWCKVRNTHASVRYVKGQLPKEVDPSKWQEGVHVKGRNELDHMPLVAQVLYKLHVERNAYKGTHEEFVDQVYQNSIRLFPQLAFD